MDKFKLLVADALEIGEKEVAMEATLDSFPTYDSLALVIILAKIDEEYGKQLRADEVRNARTVNDLFSLVEN